MTNKLSRRSFLKLTGVAGGAFLLASCEFVDSLKGVPKTQLPMIENAWSISDGTLSPTPSWLSLGMMGSTTLSRMPAHTLVG